MKTADKGTVKATEKGVKTAKATSKTAIKTTEQTAKMAQKTAKVSAKAAQKAAQTTTRYRRRRGASTRDTPMSQTASKPPNITSSAAYRN